MKISPKIFQDKNYVVDPKSVFVLMPFAENFKPIYEDHIMLAVQKAGLSCRRADNIFSTGTIMTDIWEQINQARIIIAELTGRNPNVFYEVGISHTLGKDLILISQTIDDVPSDLRAIRTIVYTYTPRGAKKLQDDLFRTIQACL